MVFIITKMFLLLGNFSDKFLKITLVILFTKEKIYLLSFALIVDLI